MHIRQSLLPGLVAGSLLFGTASAAFAAKTANPAKAAGAHRAFAAGVVSNVSATGFTLTTTPKAATSTTRATPVAKVFQVTLGANAKERALKGTTGALVNGDYALVVGSRAKTAFTAGRVLYSATAFKAGALLNRLRHPRAAGTVATGTTATSLVITTKGGKTLTFTITATTKFRVGKTPQATAPTLTVGQNVVVRYTRDATTKTLVAKAIGVKA
jgi:hypothetical protein